MPASDNETTIYTLFSNVLTQLGYTPRRITMQAERVVMTQQVSYLKDKYNLSTLKKKLVDKRMTWKTFEYLLFNFLKCARIKLSIELTHPSGDITTHNLVLYNVDEAATEKRSDNKDR